MRRRATGVALSLSLALAAALPAPRARGDWLARVTYYTWTGNPTASGYWPGPGTAACSYDLPLYAVVRLYDRWGGAEEFVCLDRGELAPTWVDLYGRPDAPQTFGDWAELEVVR